MTALSMVLAPSVFVFAQTDEEAEEAAKNAELEAQIQKKAEELKKINEELQETQEDLQATVQKGQTLNNEIKKIDGNIKTINLGIQSSEVTIEKLGLELENLQDVIYDKEVELERKKHSITALLQQRQVMDNENLLMVFLKNKTLSDSLAQAQFIEDLNNSLLTEVVNLQDIREDLNEDLEDVSDKKDKTEQEKQTLKARESIAKEQKTERSYLLAQTKNEEAEYQKIVAELAERQRKIGEEIADIEAQLRAGANTDDLPTARSGILGYPVASVLVTQDYGATAFAQRAYRSKFHNGIDFRASVGTELFAAAEGEVIAVGDNGNVQYGRYVLVKHPNNLTTLYAHMSKQSVYVGQTVERGQLIGYAGETGYVFGAHLHFTVYWSPSVELKAFSGAGLVPVGITVNPFEYF
ncbi:MAG: peptidoglycan DD-metalloendopeptidase family protein [Candidatus Paceibacterota bacterium]